MANIKELIQSIESTDSSFDEKLDAINKMEETLVALRQQEEKAIQDNVDLIVEAIKVMENKVTAQLEVAKSIVPEKGDKGDKGDKGADGRQGIDGKNGQDGLNGKDGIDGKDGVSVSNAQIDFDGSLVITLSTGQEINVGEVVAPELQERIKLVTSGGAGTVLPSQTGNANKYLKTDGSALSWAAGDGTGTVTSVGGTGTVNGLTLTGTVTTTGNLTLGGTLDLSSPPTIGNTTPNTGTFTTLIGGGGSANYGQLTGGATTKAVEFQTLGSDSNIALVLDSKGTGAIDLAAGSSGVNISNGGTVTAITGTAAGSYTTVPTITISAPTTAGGVQATGTCAMNAVTISVASGGSGYAIADTITLTGGTFSTSIILTVASLSGSAVATFTAVQTGTYTVLPTNPISQGSSSGAGTGATFNITAWGVRTTAYTITNAGSGYVEQPTITFSSGSATAYATVGSTPVIRSLSQNLDFYTPNNTSTPSFRVFDNQSAGTGQFISVRGSSTVPVLFSSTALTLSSTGANNVSIFTNANSQEQMRVSHTASAVNYVQVTGAATSGAPAISAQGSDGTIGLQLTPKGGGNITSVGGLAILNSTAIPAGGTLNTGLRFSSTASFGIFFGSGAPTLSAAQGSIYLRSDGSGTANRMYINTNGSTTWTNVVTAA